ncbi:MAG: HDOD domain-containing protein [Candidatus Dadabacteria bacterium]|nr:MAG: HDOD domain-containing protein [Candidatus Dadabacteria bacterium]
MNTSAGQTVHCSNSGERRLKRALSHVSKHWIPVNTALLEKIQHGLNDGAYDLDVEFLISELKTDVGLFAYCLRQIAALAAKNSHIVPLGSNPFDMLRTAGLDTLRAILEVPASRFSAHSFSSAENEQTASIREALISSSTVEVLSEHIDLDSEEAFCAAFLRQLGYVLIAWNYPEIYRKALNTLDEDQDLEEHLESLLGISPSMLAVSVLHGWDFTGDRPAEEQDRIQELCQVGEALARAAHPEIHRHAGRDWQFARQQLESIVGERGLHYVRERIKHFSENYASELPEIFGDLNDLNPERAINRFARRSFKSSNPYIEQCATGLRERLTSLYRNMPNENVDPSSVREIVRNIIPAAGFSGVAIYSFDPARSVLAQRMRAGTVSLVNDRSLPYPSSSIESHPVCIAFNSQVPLTANSINASGDAVTYIAAPLGNKRRVGVLYVELPSERLFAEETDFTVHFQAVKKALQDALKLK